MTVTQDKVTAVDLSKVVMVKSHSKSSDHVLSDHDLMEQEQRRQRKVRRLDFEVR